MRKIIKKMLMPEEKTLNEKICCCGPHQNKIKLEDALDIINPMGKIVARFHKDCEIHGYKRLTDKE